jgi:hypothetical protein
MHESYDELIGDTINSLIENGLAKAITYSYDVGLTSLKVGINGDYTVKSSDDLYTTAREITCFTQRKKTLIFNNGNTCPYTFMKRLEAGYPIRHLDNTSSAEERKDILQWFKKTPDAILTGNPPLVLMNRRNIILNRNKIKHDIKMIGRGI